MVLALLFCLYEYTLDTVQGMYSVFYLCRGEENGADRKERNDDDNDDDNADDG